MDADLGRETCAGPTGRGTGQRGATAVGEFDPPGGDVFDLDAVVGDEPRRGGDALRFTEEPEQEVDGVDALVHHGATAIKGERPAPGSGVVIGLCAPPRDERAGERQLTEAARHQGRLESDRAGTEAAGQDPGDGHAGLGAGGGEFIATGEGDFERLLHDDMLAGLGAGEGRGEVIAAGRAEADDVDVRVCKERLGRLGEGDAVLGREVASLGGRAIIGRDELHVGDLGERLRMELGDHAGSPDAETEGLLRHYRM